MKPHGSAGIRDPCEVDPLIGFEHQLDVSSQQFKLRWLDTESREIQIAIELIHKQDMFHVKPPGRVTSAQYSLSD